MRYNYVQWRLSKYSLRRFSGTISPLACKRFWMTYFLGTKTESIKNELTRREFQHCSSNELHLGVTL